MIISNKYLIKEIKDFKVSAKVLLNGIISYVEKDLEKRVEEFETLCERVDFRKIEKDELLKVYKKKKWIQKSSTFLSALVLKDAENEEDSDEKDSDESKSDSEKSDKDSKEKSNSKEESEEQESSDEESKDGLFVLDKKMSSDCKSVIKLKKNLITHIGTKGWAGNCFGKKATKYALEMVSTGGYIMMGFAPKKGWITTDAVHNGLCGYYYYICNGNKYGIGSSAESFGTSQPYSSGTIIGSKFDKKKGEISYYINGKTIGVAYKNLKNMDLFPAISFCDTGDVVKIVKAKFK